MSAAARAAGAPTDKPTTKDNLLEDAAISGPQEDEIAVAAYYRWLNRGSAAGSDWDDWFQAEQALKNPKL